VIRLKTWESIRLRCLRDREPIKAVARDERVAPNTVRKYLRCDEPPRSKPRNRVHILDPFQSHIDDLLRRSPRITAVRIGRYLRENVDAALRVDESTLRKFVARRRKQLVPKEAFVRASYAPGDEAQFDFSPVQIDLNGSLTVVQVFAIRLSYSGRYFARISLRSDRVALFTGLLTGLVALGGLPHRAIFDNAKTAVIKILWSLGAGSSLCCTGKGKRKRRRRGNHRLHPRPLLYADALVCLDQRRQRCPRGVLRT
jgi:hypothetical protein